MSNNISSNERKSLQGLWSSRVTFILAVTGSAIGLGNIWKFPYIAGANGGGAFVIIYLVCIFLIGFPIMVSEILLGRRGRRNPITSMKLLGKEETTDIAPAVIEAQLKGIDASGPIPADIVFHQAIRGQFDVVLAMYHDQGHIPIKVHDWAGSISVNLGLPFIRTSVDHGTAFDIAGKGIANHQSMLESIKTAVNLATGQGLVK